MESLKEPETVVVQVTPASRRPYSRPAWVDTKTSRDIMFHLNLSRGGKNVLIYGESGVGKTHTALRFIELNSRESFPIYLVTVTAEDTTGLKVLRKIVDTLGLGGSAQRTEPLVNRIEKFLGCGGREGAILIMDESQNIPDEGFDLLVSLSMNIRVVLIGNEDGYVRITGGRKKILDRVHRRIGSHCRVGMPTEQGEVKPIIDAWGVEQGQAELDFAYTFTQVYGLLGLDGLLESSAFYANRHGVPLNYDLLISMAVQLGLMPDQELVCLVDQLAERSAHNLGFN